MLSSERISHHSHEYGDILLTCPVYITRGIHCKENDVVLQYTCALLNSAGGILIMQNVERQQSQSKSLDAWWSGMECNLATILSGDDICNYLDFVGNFDDNFFYLFVKSADHLCTVEYHCRLPTDTATHSVTYSSAVKLCSRVGSRKSLADLPNIPEPFVYGQTEETLKQEGKQIQFKYLSSARENRKSLPEKIGYYCTKYISAFANHEGGHIYFGIEDTSAAVLGELMTEEDERKTAEVIHKKMDSFIWGDERFQGLKKIHWNIKFIPVLCCPNKEQRKVVVVSVCKMYGGVFSKCPESFVVSENSKPVNPNVRYTVRKLDFDHWKAELLSQSREIKALHTRFVKLPLHTPQSRLVYSLPQTLQYSRDKVIKLSKSLSLQPKNILNSFLDQKTCSVIKQIINNFVGEPHLVISVESWGLGLKLPLKPACVKACLAVFSSLYGIQVIIITSESQSGEDIWRFTQQIAIHLKQVLVQHGGCHTHLGLKLHVIDMENPLMMEYFQGAIDRDIFPQTYQLREDSLNEVLNSLTIAIASYKPFSDCDGSMETDHYFMLTCDQLELLWTHQFTRDLWVHGPPGSGKTIAALEMMRELLRRGCTVLEILYVAENTLLCSYVRSFQMCTVVSRRELMAETMSEEMFERKYSRIRNVIIDEAQNYKDRDGDWYSLAEKLAKQNFTNTNDLTAGYFWVFMDYAQKVHKFKAGLPGLIGKNNFMLREISRNSKEIFEYASRFMEKPSTDIRTHEKSLETSVVPDSPHLAHEFSTGQEVCVMKCDDLHSMLQSVLKQFNEQGVAGSNIAVLVSKKKEVAEVENSVQALGSDHSEMLNSETDHQNTERHVQASVSSEQMNVHDSMEQEVLAAISRRTPNSEKCNIGTTNSAEMDTAGKDQSVQCYTKSQIALQPSNKDHVLVSTVRDFSGLDKPVIIGLNPHTNQDHADLNKFLLNLVTRAKDSLVILTTSDSLIEKLKFQ